MLGYTRKKIRGALNAALTGVSSVSGRVVSGEEKPNLSLPNITYTIASEDFESESAIMAAMADPQDRLARIEIEGRALFKNGSESPIDDLCLEIETAIGSATTLHDWVQDLRLVSTEYELAEEDKPIGLATLKYAGIYEEAWDVDIEDLSYTPSQDSIQAEFNTDIACRMRTVAYRPESISGMSEWETESSKTHDLTVTGLSANTVYAMFCYLESDAYGVDITEGPDEGNLTNYLTDGIANSWVFTLA